MMLKVQAVMQTQQNRIPVYCGRSTQDVNARHRGAVRRCCGDPTTSKIGYALMSTIFGPSTSILSSAG